MKNLNAVLVLGLGLVLVSRPCQADTDSSFAAAVASAQGEFRAAKTKSDAAVVRDFTTTVRADLNTKTVKCSAADYSSPMLKVLIPALADLTILNHRNFREGAPCVAAGACGEIGPKDILKAGEGSEKIAVRVIVKKETELEGDVCRVTLVETVYTVIRGVPFFHERRQAVADRTPDDCR